MSDKQETIDILVIKQDEKPIRKPSPTHSKRNSMR